MSRVRRHAVLIQNPLPGGAAHTTRKAAVGFIRRGLAVWIDSNAIRFVAQGRRMAESRMQDLADEPFWWRRGKTGGMVQVLGSTVEARPAQSRTVAIHLTGG